MKTYQVDTVSALIKVLEQFKADAYVQINEDNIQVYEMVNHFKYDKQGYITADDWRKKTLAEIELI